MARVPLWSSPRQVGTLSFGESDEMLSVDLNGDRLRDVVIQPDVWERPEPRPPIILINKGGGQLVDETNALLQGVVPAFLFGRELLPADFNRDGRPDIFVADSGFIYDPDPSFQRQGGQEHLLLSTADGHLTDASANLPQQLTFTHSAAVADVNGDGAPDIFENNVGCCSVGHVQAQVLLNDGTGHFTLEPNAIRGMLTDPYGNDHSYACVFADVNRDGSPDLVLGGSEQEDASQIMLNDGHGHFSFAGVLPPTLGPPGNAFVIDMKAADINGDGSPDLLLAETLNDPYYIGTTLQILLNDGHGHFADVTSQWIASQPDTKSWPDRLITEDVNDDGRPDLTIQYASAGRDPTPVWLNTGTRFERITPLVNGDVAASAGGLGPVAYINGDGPHALVSIEWADHNGGTPNVYVTPQIVYATSVRAVRARKTMRVTWAAAPQATGYQVLRNGRPIATTHSTTFVDRAPGVRPRYTVRVL